MKVIRPQTFNEAQIVADFLKEGKTIVVNLEESKSDRHRESLILSVEQVSQ
ncbi:cell division protein SepF [Anaerobutyricum hallii]|nr:cell division protein SepF [Anaerobutyricum hallii]